MLYLDKLESLIARYRGEEFEDEMVGFYPLLAFGENRVAASIDTPLHAFLPFDHVDHLHPDWAIALAASANGKARLEQFNQKYGRKIVWVPWQRPGFELALMLRKAVEDNPGCDGIILGGHGLFTWGDTQRECYVSSIKTIDQMGEFVQEHARRSGEAQFGGATAATAGGSRVARRRAAAIPPRRRVVEPPGDRALRQQRRCAGLRQLEVGGGAVRAGHQLSRPLPAHAHLAALRAVEAGRTASPRSSRRSRERLITYREDYAKYYKAHADKTSPALRDSNPSVVVVPGLGLFGFGKDKREARITSEFFVNAIHVMAGANALEDSGRQARAGAAGAARRAGGRVQELPQLRRAAAQRGVPHRVLGARRGQAAAHAARA